jgi:anti-anti-sigma factor
MLRTVTEQGVVPEVFLSGEMDLDCAESLRAAVAAAARGAEVVFMDLAGVSFVDSSGTGVFVRICIDMSAQGVRVRARNLSPAVADVFAMLKVHDLVGDEVFVG